MSTTPVVHLELRISPRIFKKIREDPDGTYLYTQGLGGNWFTKKNQSQKSHGTVPLSSLESSGSTPFPFVSSITFFSFFIANRTYRYWYYYLLFSNLTSLCELQFLSGCECSLFRILRFYHFCILLFSVVDPISLILMTKYWQKYSFKKNHLFDKKLLFTYP